MSRKVQRYSQLQTDELPKTKVLILDTIGLLNACYASAQMAYVGGGMGTSGLHNVLEPAAAGIPVVIGKNYQKVEEAKEMIRLGGMLSVQNSKSFTEVLYRIAKDSKQRMDMGEINHGFANAQKGASSRILDFLA